MNRIDAEQVFVDATPSVDLSSQDIGLRTRDTNLFDMLRILAASLVLWGHSFSLTGGVPPAWFGNSVGTLGVKIFFVISGVLVTQSWLADPRPWPYAVRRVLRILPALMLVVLLTVSVLGPVFTTLPLRDYLTSSGTSLYLWNILLFPIYSLPGVFSGNPYPYAVNGSLWSLPAEVLMYILTPFVVGQSAVRSKLGAAIFAIISAAAAVYFARINPIVPAPVVYGTGVASVLEVGIYFQAGCLCAVFNLQRFGRPMFSVLLLIISALVVQQASRVTNIYVFAEVILMFTLPFAVISIGFVKVRGKLGRVLAAADVSYGLYLYGFPVQQTISAIFAGKIGPLANFLVTLPLTFLCALLSWKTVEQAALRLKPRRAVAGKAWI